MTFAELSNNFIFNLGKMHIILQRLFLNLCQNTRKHFIKLFFFVSTLTAAYVYIKTDFKIKFSRELQIF